MALEFTFKDQKVRLVMIEGAPWFCEADVCGSLSTGVRPDGTVGVGENKKKLNDDEKRLVGVSMANRVGFKMTSNRPVNLISESGLCKMVMRCDKP